MSATSNCPNCTQPVTIPDGLEPAAVVRCPTCEAEYPLSEALAGVTDQEQASSETMAFLKSLEAAEPGSGAADVAPPELVPVAAVSEHDLPATPEEAAAEESGMVLENGPSDQPAEPPQQAEEPDLVIEEVAGAEEPDLVIEEVAGAEEPDLVIEEVAGEPGEGFAPTEQPVEVLDGPQVETEEPQGEAGAATEAIEAAVHEPPAVVEEAEAGGTGCETPAEGSDGLSIEPEEGAEAAGVSVAAAEATAEQTPGEPAGQPEHGAEVAEPAEAAAEEAKEKEKEKEEPAAVDPDPLVRGPHGEAEFRLSELIVVSSGEPLGPVTASVIAGHGLLRPLAEDEAKAVAKEAPALDVWGKIEAAPQLDLGYAAGAGAADHAGFAIRDSELAEERAADTMPARPRPKRKEKSIVRVMVEVVLGGIVAVPLAAYLAVMIKGDQANFLKSPLPGCPSTYHRCPDWWPQWLKIGAGDEGIASEDGSDSTKAAPKAGAKAAKPGAKKPNGKDPFATGPKAKQQPKGPKPTPSKPPAKKEKPKPAPASPVGLLDPPSYTSDQLGDALAKANAAFGCKNCNSTGKVTKIVTEVQEIGGKKKEVKKKKTVECEVCDGHPLRAMNDSAYDEFCQVSRVVTFVQGADDDAQLANRKRAVRDLAEKAGGSDAELARIGELAAARLADEGRLEAGVFLAGTVQKTGPRGAVHESKILLSSSGKPVTVTVLSPRSLPAAANDRVLVLGSIVEEPRQNLAGYEGPESLVVWAGECVKLP